MSDYRKAEIAVELLEAEPDPSTACEESILAYLEHADSFLKDKGYPFWGWANDVGSWLAKARDPDDRGDNPTHQPLEGSPYD